MYTQITIIVCTNGCGLSDPACTHIWQMDELPPKLARLQLRVARGDLRVWREAAVREKQKLSEWIRRACDERAANAAKEKNRKSP